MAQLPSEVVDILLTDLFALRVHAFICNFPLELDFLSIFSLFD